MDVESISSSLMIQFTQDQSQNLAQKHNNKATLGPCQGNPSPCYPGLGRVCEPMCPQGLAHSRRSVTADCAKDEPAEHWLLVGLDSKTSRWSHPGSSVITV